MGMEYTPDSVMEFVVWFKLHGSSLILNWGEYPGHWEVSWIHNGNRFTACHGDLLTAMTAVFKDAA